MVRDLSSKRLALLIPDLRMGGAEQVALRLMQDWVRDGHEVDLVLLSASGELLPLVPPSVQVFDLKAPRIRAAIRPLVAYLKDRRPDAVQASMWPVTILAIIAGRLARSRARVLVSEHITLSRQYADLGRLGWLSLKASIRLFYPRADARVAVSNGAANDLAKLSGIDRESIAVIYNPVQELSGSVPTKIDALWGDAKSRILSVGRLKAQKNQRLLIEAFARLPVERRARLMLLGDGPELGDLQELARRLGVDGQVIFRSSDINPGPYYRSADLFVLSSDYEGFGLVIVEALLSGLPVVSTDCESGPREILGDGEYGALVPCGDAAALAAAVEAALDAPVDEDRQRARGRLFSGADSAQRYLDLMIG